MRRKTSKILLLSLLTGLAPLSGFALVHKAAPKASAKPAATHAAASHSTEHAATASAHGKAVKEQAEAGTSRRGRAKVEAVSAKASTRHVGSGKAAGKPTSGRSGTGRSSSAKSSSARFSSAKFSSATSGHGRTVPGKTSASAEPARRELGHARSTESIADVSPAAEPLQESRALPEIHVTHNRKQHLKPSDPVAVPEGADPGPTPIAEAASARKARPQDFLTKVPASASTPVTGVSHPDAEPITTSDGSETAPVIGAALRLAPSAATPAVLPGVTPGAKTPAPVVRVKPIAEQAATLAVLRKPAPVLPVAEAHEKELLPPPVAMPALYTKSGRLIVPAALKGSHDILIHQNVMADHDGLDRIQDDDDLLRMRDAKLLVAVPENAEMRADERLPANRRYARPWTVAFLNAIAKAHYARFHEALQVNSAVRTVEFQERLIRTNGNAAPAEGDTASPHLTGQAVDLAKHGLSMTEIAWMRGYLLPLVQEGKIDVEEEFQQACFHISVYRKYLPQAEPKRTIAPHRTTGMALAAALE